ncbi:hypothetical protein [Ammoniphilus sp. YIM 78166]|uniref:hypothetical protein n=1 Tax=Ammoniphilus sp. YIM 78166 TaxID=1644106 RepID=UPI00106F163D|nr:hypothetical protein [Ammoniphilus sp. YIM 78166]
MNAIGSAKILKMTNSGLYVRYSSDRATRPIVAQPPKSAPVSPNSSGESPESSLEPPNRGSTAQKCAGIARFPWRIARI